MLSTTVTFALKKAPHIAQSPEQNIQITAGASNSLSIVLSKGKPDSSEYETKTISIVKPSRSMINVLERGHVINCTYGEQNSLEVQSLNISMQGNKDNNSLSTLTFETGGWIAVVKAEEAFDVLTTITGF